MGLAYRIVVFTLAVTLSLVGLAGESIASAQTSLAGTQQRASQHGDADAPFSLAKSYESGESASLDLAQAASQSPPPVTPSEVARLLVGEGSVVRLATEERVRRSIATGAPTFALPGGASSVMLLELPDY